MGQADGVDERQVDNDNKYDCGDMIWNYQDVSVYDMDRHRTDCMYKDSWEVTENHDVNQTQAQVKLGSQQNNPDVQNRE